MRVSCPIVLVCGALALGQEPLVANRRGGESAPLAAFKFTPSVVGSLNCSSCHAHPENYPNESLICRMVEYPVWKTRDRHQIAYDVLLSPRAQEMGRRLGITVTENEGACVSCHGIVIPKGVAPFQFVARSEGVTCVACHGLGKEWIEQHMIPNSADWRKLTRAEKQDLKGMRDLWDPKTRVETCLSCHVGAVEQGKTLTHAMYAAGHPPLPAIETATFSDQEPRHWQYLREKSPEVQKQLGFNPERLEQTELVAVSGLAAMTASLRLLTAPASDQIDFARYDCAACHHDLSVSDRSWRQARGYKGSPGRPTAPAWPLALVRIGLEAAEPDRADLWNETLRQKLRELDQAMAARPFGDLARAGTIAREIVTWTEEPLGVLGQMARARPGQPGPVVDRGRALKMLRRIGSIAAERVPDYDSARQLAWAFRTIYHELVLEPAQRNPKIEAIFDRLDQKLKLSLGTLPTAERRPVVDQLPERMKAAESYSPADFQQDMAELVKLL
jgi:hypothetical protein